MQALAASCHPVPTVAVTVMSTVLVAAAGNRLWACVVAAAAVLTGQLSIGWSNDAIDASRDRRAGRTDKPVARGDLSLRAVWVAAAMAVIAAVPLSLVLGWRSGLVQLSVVGWGWLYNWWLKSTPLSALPFLFAFGGLPAIGTLALPGHCWPPASTLAAAGLIGVAAHFANVLPDLDDDRHTGVSGLPHRLGRAVASVVAVCAALAATLTVVAAEADGGPTALWLLGGFALVIGCAGLLAARRHPRSDAAFHATMAIAATGVAMIVVSGGL